MRIAIAGLGTVGASALKMLQENASTYAARCGKDLKVSAVSARSKGKNRGVDLSTVDWCDDPLQIIDKADIIVELIGGADGTAYDLAKKAITSGKHFVTANKALIAKHGIELSALATKHNVSLAFEAAVAGGIPVIKTLKEGLSANHVSLVAGVLNGTCNYILTEMEKTRRSFDDVLKEAQDLGYAEADPSFDIDGIDTNQKLTILTTLAFGCEAKETGVEGITSITLDDMDFAQTLGYRIKLLGIARLENGKLVRGTYPAFVKQEQAIAGVDGAFNAIEIMAEPVGKIVLEGRGAGGGPTASAVVADIMDIARGNISHGFTSSSQLDLAGPEKVESAFYLRLNVVDKPGVVAEISGLMRDNNISIESLHQRSRHNSEAVNIFMTIHKTTELAMEKLLGQISNLKTVIKKPVKIRIVEI